MQLSETNNSTKFGEEFYWFTWEAISTFILQNCNQNTNNDKCNSQGLIILSNMEKKSIDPLEKPVVQSYYIIATKIPIMINTILKDW